MNITIIGAGNIGGTLGGKWAAAGHKITFGVRDPLAEKAQLLLQGIGLGATAVPIPDSLTDAAAVLFAIPGKAMTTTINQLGAALDGKLLIDASNNVGEPIMHSLDPLRQAAPGSPLVRAFSNLGWENFAHPHLEGLDVDLFYCSDQSARETMDALITDIGLRPVYIGGPDQAATIDTLTRLWFTLALQQGRGRRLAFKLLGGS